MEARSAILIKNTVCAIPVFVLWCMVSMVPSWAGVLMLALIFYVYGTSCCDG